MEATQNFKKPRKPMFSQEIIKKWRKEVEEEIKKDKEKRKERLEKEKEKRRQIKKKFPLFAVINEYRRPKMLL